VIAPDGDVTLKFEEVTEVGSSGSLNWILMNESSAIPDWPMDGLSDVIDSVLLSGRIVTLAFALCVESAWLVAVMVTPAGLGVLFGAR
jgi:hypothetical protein